MWLSATWRLSATIRSMNGMSAVAVEMHSYRRSSSARSDGGSPAMRRSMTLSRYNAMTPSRQPVAPKYFENE